MAKGITPSWQRPCYVRIQMPRTHWGVWDIDLLKLLVETKMAQSMTEARRVLFEQRLIWYSSANGLTSSSW